MGNRSRIIPTITLFETLAWLMGRRFRFAVQGHSMEPTLYSGQTVLLRKPSIHKPIAVGDMIVFTYNTATYIKRVESIQSDELGDRYRVTGDNVGHSKEFDFIPSDAIIGIATSKV